MSPVQGQGGVGVPARPGHDRAHPAFSSRASSPALGCIREIRPLCIRLHAAFVHGQDGLPMLCRVRVLFPHIGIHPVVFDVAFEQFGPDGKRTVFPTAEAMFEHLHGLTTIYR